MCTVTWRLEAPDSYELFFNRDERRTRPRALPPGIHQNGRLAYVAATDPQGGGTWLACNQAGLSVGLLNFYAAEGTLDGPPSRGAGIDGGAAHHRSRGLLVASMTDAASPAEVRARIGSLDPAAYRPFLLFCLAPFSDPDLWAWDGRSLSRATPVLPLTTSSYENAAVSDYRRRQFLRFGSGRLEAFHRSYDAARRAHSVFMSRPDARTVSFSRVRVGPDGIRFRYAEPTDDATAFIDTADVRLALQRAS